MAKVYVTLAPVGEVDPNGAPVPLLGGRPLLDGEFTATGTSAKLTATAPTFVAPSDQVGVYTRYCWLVTAVDGAVKVVAGKDPNATTGTGYRLVAGADIEFAAEEAGETLALVTI